MNSNYQAQYQFRVIGILVILFIPLILPDYLQNINIINNISTLFVGIIFIYLSVISFIKKQFNLFIIASFVFIVWRMLSSYYLSNGVLDLVNSFRIITLVLLVNITIKHFPKSTLQALGMIFGLYIIINLITIFAFPNGLYVTSSLGKGWFLGIENQYAYILIPGVILISLSSLYRYKRISLLSWIVISIAFITVLQVWSATAIVAMSFIIMSILLVLWGRLKKIYSFLSLSILYTIIWLFLVRFNSLDSFQAIIVSILNKDLTLSFRTNIWATIFETIPDSLWYGYGINSEVKAGIVTYFAAHNMILQTILDSGMIGLLLFLLCLIICGLRLQKVKRSQLSALILIGIFGILIGGLAESYRLNYLFLLLTLAYNVNHIIKSYESSRI